MLGAQGVAGCGSLVCEEGRVHDERPGGHVLQGAPGRGWSKLGDTTAPACKKRPQLRAGSHAWLTGAPPTSAGVRAQGADKPEQLVRLGSSLYRRLLPLTAPLLPMGSAAIPQPPKIGAAGAVGMCTGWQSGVTALQGKGTPDSACPEVRAGVAKTHGCTALSAQIHPWACLPLLS